MITGYPVLGPRIEFARDGLVANKEDWNKLVMVAKMVTDNEVQDVMKFVGQWGGGAGGAAAAAGAPGFSFQ